MFKVTVSYPDGHIEEIDDTFETSLQAKSFGESMMRQIESTEDIKGKRGKNRPYFLVLDASKRPAEIIFDSRK